MPILTKPTITKGTPATFTLDKSLLAALPSVANDTYFSNQSNWNKIVLSFKSTTGSQNEVVVFDATSATPTGTFLISLRARDAFNIIKIDIYDFDNGGISIPRSALNAAEFDIDLSAPTPPPTPSLTAYQYIKLVFKEAWVATNGAAVTSDMTVSEIRMKWDDTAQSLSSLTPTTNIPLFYGTLLEIVNNVSAGGDFPGWASLVSEPFLLFNLGQQRTVQEILIAPQYGNASVSHNMPKKFDILGSNNGSDFTLISAVNQSNTDSWISGQYNVFDCAPTPVVLSVFDTFYGAIGYNGSNQIQRTGGGADWVNVAYRSVPCGQDFLLSGTVNTTSVSFNNAMIGYKKSMPLSGGSAADNLATAAYFISQAQCNMYAGSGNTASTGGITAWGITQPIEYSIQRVSGVITCVVNGFTLFTDNYAGDVYLGIDIFDSLTLSISTTLSEPTTGLIYTKDFGALNYAADLSFDTYTSWVLNGSTARAAGLGNLEMTLTNAAMLAGIIEGNSYIIRIYVASATGAGYLGGNLKGGYIDQNLFQFTNPLPPYYEQTVVAGAGASFRLDASNLPHSYFFEISKIEIFDGPLYTRNFTSPNSLIAGELLNTNYSSADFGAQGLDVALALAHASYVEVLERDFSVGLITGTYKVRVHIASYSGNIQQMNINLMDSNTMPNGSPAVVLGAELMANVGGYVERTIVGASQLAYVVAVGPYLGTGTLTISKIEIFAA